LLDYRMPDRNGVDIARQIPEQCPELSILIYASSRETVGGGRAAGGNPRGLRQARHRLLRRYKYPLHEQTYFSPLAANEASSKRSDRQ